MPEDQLDSGSEQQEQALPKPVISGASSDQQNSTAATADARFDKEAFLNEVRDVVKREVQSARDQRVDKIQKQLGIDPRKIVEEIKGGKDPDKVLEDLERQSVFDRLDVIEQRTSSQPQPSTSGKSETDDAFEKAVGLVRKAGLANDPEVQELFKGTYSSSTDFLFAVNEKVLARNTKPAPSPASATMPAKGQGGKRDASVIQSEISDLLASRAVTSIEGRQKLAELRSQLTEIEGA